MKHAMPNFLHRPEAAVIPAKAGIQGYFTKAGVLPRLDSRLRGNDKSIKLPMRSPLHPCKLILAALTVALGGCAVGPTYQRPSNPDIS